MLAVKYIISGCGMAIDSKKSFVLSTITVAPPPPPVVPPFRVDHPATDDARVIEGDLDCVIVADNDTVLDKEL